MIYIDTKDSRWCVQNVKYFLHTSLNIKVVIILTGKYSATLLC